MKSTRQRKANILLLAALLAGCNESVESKPKHDLTSGANNAWALDAVWYQIFPERFSNGDTTNDPNLSDLTGAYPHDSVGPWSIHPWGADWYALQSNEKTRDKGIWHAIQLRRTGGDLQGVINRLDYLADLGVNALDLNPIFGLRVHTSMTAKCITTWIQILARTLWVTKHSSPQRFPTSQRPGSGPKQTNLR